jgi:hypothetical protein
MKFGNASIPTNEAKPTELWAEAIREELFQALENSNLDLFEVAGSPLSAEAEAAAFELAVALGQCRVCGVEIPPELDGTLPVPVAQAASRVLARLCEQLTEDITQLPDELGEASPPEADVILGDFFEGLMQTYFAMEAISECYERMLEEDDPDRREFDLEYDRALDAIGKLDAVLSEADHLVVLSEVVNLPVYRNWKAMLAEPYRSVPPWWLDGTLEEVAREVWEVFKRPVSAVSASRETAKVLLRQASVEHKYSVSVLCDLRPPVALAAAAPEDRPPVRFLLLWDSPDGKYVARLSVPEYEPQDGLVVLEILYGNYEPAKEFAGVPVWLSGVRAQVDECGIARFALADLRNLPAGPETELVLEVKEQGQKWQPKG